MHIENVFYAFIFLDVVGLSIWNVYLLTTTPGFSNTVILLASILSVILIVITGILIRRLRR